MKNELIIATRSGHRKRSAARRMHELLAPFGLQALLPERFPLLPPLHERPETPESA